ncbi:hypothetical protein QQP08_021900 [Theobroma cacao]|nr:hypothetical protein QQP08_021900 [Theobroma cacao]
MSNSPTPLEFVHPTYSTKDLTIQVESNFQATVGYDQRDCYEIGQTFAEASNTLWDDSTKVIMRQIENLRKLHTAHTRNFSSQVVA